MKRYTSDAWGHSLGCFWRNQISLITWSMITIHCDVLGFLADFDDVPLAVADFEKLGIATVLDRSGENSTIRELLVSFL